MTIDVPEDFVDKMVDDIDHLYEDSVISEKQVDQLLGRAGRLAYLVPVVKPYVSMLWAAKAAAYRHQSLHKARTSGRRYPTQRFQHAAGWIHTLLRPPVGQALWLPLQHIVVNYSTQINEENSPTVEFDASPWGYGAQTSTTR